MAGIASNRLAPPLYQRHVPARPRSDAKRSRIIDVAMQHFAEHGYQAARVGDIALPSALRKAQSFNISAARMDCSSKSTSGRSGRSQISRRPAEVRAAGFFQVLRYWLVRTEHLLHEDWIPYRISLLETTAPILS